MAGLGITVVITGLATPGLSTGARIAICGPGGVLMLLAMGWPQRLAEKIIRGVEKRMRETRREHETATATQLLRGAADNLSSLPTRELGEMPSSRFLAMGKARQPDKAIAIYRRRHQAATVHAVEAGLSASAKDGGALQLAQDAADNTDLLELKGELLRMVVELTPSSQ